MPRTNKILIRSGTVAPTASDFAVGEPAFDKSAGKLYIKNAAGTMVELGTGGGGGSVVTAATVSAFPATGLSSNLYITTEDQRIWRWDSTASVYVEAGPLGGGGSGSVGVYEFVTTANFPATGAAAVIYIATDTGRIYRWAGTAYIEMGPIGSDVDSLLRSLLVPPAPTGLTATAGNAQVSLLWTAPTGVLSQAPVTDYRKQYSTDNGTSWTTFTAAASTATTATITGLTNGTAVRFRVAAVNGVGVGAYTAASSSVTPGLASAPTGLTANAGNAQIALAWTAPASVGASAITGYTVEYTPSGGSAQTVSTGGTGTTYTLTGLTNGTAYTVRVAAVNSVGTGTYSAGGSATPVAGATVTGGTVSTPGDGYVYRTFTSNGTLNISGSALTADVLVVGAGGSGSRSRSGGGGGGGGVLYQTSQSIPAGSYAVTVAGTATRTNSGNGAAGGSSSIASLYVATGGTGGISTGNYRHTGGTSGFPTTTSNSAGNAGGLGDEVDPDGGGSGGGAGGVGQNARNSASAPGGAGRTVFGVVYGTGGRGGSEGLDARADGTANRGQGGSGGQDYSTNTAGNGGSGVVIIRYAVA